jgi:uncharacterized RDD family membrane protein YckC
MSRFCEECGAGVPADAVYCDECGTMVETTATVARPAGPPVFPPIDATPVSPERSVLGTGLGKAGSGYRTAPSPPARRPSAINDDDAPPPSTWPRRAAAVLVESVILTVCTYGPLIAAVGVGSFDGVFLALGFMLLLPLAYSVLNGVLICRRGPHNGQSLGKQMLGVRIVRENGDPFTLGPLIGRGFACFICGFIFPVDLLWPLWDRNDQTLHDKLTHTRVLRVADAEAFLARIHGRPASPRIHADTAPVRPRAYPAPEPDPHRVVWPAVAALVAIVGFVGGGAAILIAGGDHGPTTAKGAGSSNDRREGEHSGQGPTVTHVTPPPESHDEWPDDVDAYTVQLASRTTFAGAQEVVRESRAEGVSANVLESSRYPSNYKHPGYYVVYSGAYGTRDDAQAHLAAAKSVRADAFVKWISPAGHDAPEQPKVPPRPHRPAPFSAEYQTTERGTYTIDVPVGWEVTEDPGDDESYVETRWTSLKKPDTSVLVGVTPDSTATPLQAATELRDETASQDGYRQLLWRSTTAHGVPAWKWIFSTGDQEQVAYFIQDCSTGFRVIGSAPAGRFRLYQGIFSHIADSLEAQC